MPSSPAITLGPAAGTSPPALSNNGFDQRSIATDDRMVISHGTGTATVAGVLGTVKLGGNYSGGVDGSAQLLPQVQALNANTQACGLFASVTDGRTIVVNAAVAPPVSLANGGLLYVLTTG